MRHLGFISISYGVCCRYSGSFFVNSSIYSEHKCFHSVCLLFGLVLGATVFQGTGLEVLSFCAFSALFFFAACTISMCRRPRNVLLIPATATNMHSIGPADLVQVRPPSSHTPCQGATGIVNKSSFHWTSIPLSAAVDE